MHLFKRKLLIRKRPKESDKPFIKTRHLPDQLTREGDEKRGERMVTRGRGEGEENFMQMDKDPLNPLSLCFIAGHTYRIVTTGRRAEERR